MKFISANSLQEMCFQIGPSSKETVKLQKTTVKREIDRLQGQRERAESVNDEAQTVI